MSDLRQYNSFGGNTIWLNHADRHLILRRPSKAEMAELFGEFRQRQWAWLKDWLCQPDEDRGMICGMAASRVRSTDTKNGTARWFGPAMAKIKLENIPDAAWDAFSNVAPLPMSPASTRLFNATIDQQRNFLLTAMGPSLETAEPLFKPNYREALFAPWLSESFTKIEDPASFIQEVVERSVAERKRIPEEKFNAKKFLRNPIADLFLLWLSQHGIVLFPIVPQPLSGDARGFDEFLWLPSVQESWRVIEDAYTHTAKQNHARWIRPIKLVFRSLILASTLRHPDDVSLELFDAAYTLMDQALDVQVTDRLHWVYRPLRDSLGQRDLPTFKPIRYKRPELENPFAWTQLSVEEHPQSTFPRKLNASYKPMSHLCAWGDRFANYIAKLPIKSIGNSIVTCQRFLVWLVDSGVEASNLTELTRANINDGKPLSTSSCFRAHLHRDGVKPETGNAGILRLSQTFEAIIEEDRLSIPNPVVIRFDTFYVPVSRGKTPRRPMGRELMEYLRVLNRRGNYALSRSCASHQRAALSSSGQYENIWFPGIAVLVELLLQLPLRSFQARFLDSGEGDELIVGRAENHQVMLVPNMLDTATKERREGVFYLFEAADGAQTVGLHVNTNKTAVDRVSGYEIAWCSVELQNALAMVRDWQVQYNPVARPVVCMEKHDYETTQNEDILNALKTTYALFRDPSDARGWPISRDKLFEYWSLLLARAEDELAVAGRKIRITVAKEVSKGPNKRPVLKRQAAYDIHTLRVSGISALIEAGMPPDLVQEVAGHATCVMTLYYNKIKASRLNQTLSDVLDKLSTGLDSIDGIGEADFERLSEFLMNNRDVNDAAGLSLLNDRRGHGDGAVEVMIHGICPAGECATGGEYLSQAVGYAPVPRPLACSLCRYRLTGPMFLPGLVLNANRLMHELRTKGKEIADLNEDRERLEDEGKPIFVIKAKIESLYIETDIVGAEWAAEVQYVHVAEKLMEQFISESGSFEASLPALVTGVDYAILTCELEKKSELSLLQSLAEGAQLWPGFKPSAAIDNHREFLNEVLAASNLEPFLLKLRGDLRDQAATLLGRVITAMVPDEHLEYLRTGQEQIDDYPLVSAFFKELHQQVLTSGVIDESKLMSSPLLDLMEISRA
jgi:Putative phage integrase